MKNNKNITIGLFEYTIDAIIRYEDQYIINKSRNAEKFKKVIHAIHKIRSLVFNNDKFASINIICKNIDQSSLCIELKTDSRDVAKEIIAWGNKSKVYNSNDIVLINNNNSSITIIFSNVYVNKDKAKNVEYKGKDIRFNI